MRHQNFTSCRLTAELVEEWHAKCVHPIVQDPTLYTFIPDEPPSLPQLQERYRFWQSRISPDGMEYWLNYVLFLSTTDECVGTLQAGVNLTTREASVAYMITTSCQKRGLGTEALSALINHLQTDYDVRVIKAWIDVRNRASIRLVERLGLSQVEFIQEADFFKGEKSDEYVFSLTL